MNTIRIFVALIIGGLCEAKIWEIPLPKQIQDCYNKVQDADIQTYVGSTLSWMCESNIRNSQLNKTAQLDAQKISYYKRLLEKSTPNNTDGGEAVSRRKRQAGRPRCVRREYRMLSDEQRQRFHAAVNALKSDTTVAPNKYDAISLLHQAAVDSAHAGPGFTGWHRLYLLMFETALQEVDPSVCLPYWDSSLDSELEDPTLSSLWTPALFGTPNGLVVQGPFANWITPRGAQLIRNVGSDGELFTAAAIRNVLSRRRYEDITSSPQVRPRYDLEFHHGGVHMFCGGSMSLLGTAAYDPIFFLVHAFVDYIWELFRTNLRAIGMDPERYPDIVTPDSPHHSSASIGFGDLHQADGYRNAFSETFEYQPSPTCSSTSPQCGSRYLTCLRRIGRCVPITAGTAMSSLPNRAISKRSVFPEAKLPHPTITPSPEIPGEQLTGGTPIDTRCLNSGNYYGQPIQNDFCCDNTCDINLWAMIPVKIISVRPPKFNKYRSYPVHNGRIDSHDDIYSPRAYTKTNRYITQRLSNPKTYRRCRKDDSVGQVFLSSRGINYSGYYKEAAIVDQRLAVSISMGFVAVKKPEGAEVSKAIIRAHDSCGRVCQATCKDPLTGNYKECKGAIAVSTEHPAMYGSSYDEAVVRVFDYEYNNHLPQFNNSNFFMSFHCDYHSKFPYASKPGVVPQPPVAVKSPSDPATPSNTECQVTPDCILDVSCASMQHQCRVYNEKYICRGSCQSYAVCMYWRFFLSVCEKGYSFDNILKRCTPGGCQDNQPGH